MENKFYSHKIDVGTSMALLTRSMNGWLLKMILSKSGWRFQIFLFPPLFWGNDPILMTNIFQMG